jgi:hypothetical protein
MPALPGAFAQAPTATAPIPSDAPVGQQKKGAEEGTITVIPFARASKLHTEQSNTIAAISMVATTTQFFNFPIASYGFLSCILITVQASGGTTTTAAVPYEDAPWSVLSQVLLQDVNGVPIYQLSGFNAFLAAKYGGYRLFPFDDVVRGDSNSGAAAASLANTAQISGGGPPVWAAQAATATNLETGVYWQNVDTTNGVNGGSFKFILPVFLEFGLDGMGVLPNMDASARYNLQLSVAPSLLTTSATGPFVTAGVWSVNPTLTITVEILARSQPPATDMFGNPNSVSPPSIGSVQYWTAQTASGLANGANTIQLTRVGNLVRNHILVWRNTNGTRLTAEFNSSTGTTNDVPGLFEFDWDVGQRFVSNIATLRMIFQWQCGFGDVPNGVLVLPNTLDPDWLAFSEYGDQWIPTVGASKLTLRFTTNAGGGSLTILTNDVVPASSQVYEAPRLLIA